MIRQQAFKYELAPTGEQVRLMRRFAGARRHRFRTPLADQCSCWLGTPPSVAASRESRQTPSLGLEPGRGV